MFETCMVESAGQVRAANRKWTAAGAFALESLVLAIIVVAAAARVEMLPRPVFRVMSAPYAMPRVTEIVGAAGGDGSHSSARPTSALQYIPSGTSHPRDNAGDEPPLPPGIPGGPSGPTGSAIPSLDPPRVVIERPQRIRLSVIEQARITRQVQPIYPAAAKLARIAGQVQLRAIIAKDGSIDRLEVVSGHPMLTAAALEAVRQWRYRPTYLGGAPVEVETTITINFTLNR